LFFQRELKHFSRDFWENEIREWNLMCSFFSST
jgi:hypothetical protein